MVLIASDPSDLRLVPETFRIRKRKAKPKGKVQVPGRRGMDPPPLALSPGRMCQEGYSHGPDSLTSSSTPRCSSRLDEVESGVERRSRVATTSLMLGPTS